MELILIDQQGWTKTVKIEKGITRIGSGNGNDIPLKASGIAPVHLQILRSEDYASSCMVTNLSAETVVQIDQAQHQLQRNETIQLTADSEIALGNYRLVLKFPLTTYYVQTTNLIGASLSFPDPVLRPDLVALGNLNIENKGERPDCQFKVNVSGFPANCYKIDPIPLMYPGAEEEVRVHFFHQAHEPQAGPYDVVFSITAPNDYPGEELIIKQELYVLPVYKHTIEVIDDIANAARLEPVVPRTPPAEPGLDSEPPPPPVVQPEVLPVPEETQPDQDKGAMPDREEDISLDIQERPEPVPVIEEAPEPPPEPVEPQVEPEIPARRPRQPEPGPPKVQDRSNVKVIRDQFDEFWEEE